MKKEHTERFKKLISILEKEYPSIKGLSGEDIKYLGDEDLAFLDEKFYGVAWYYMQIW